MQIQLVLEQVPVYQLLDFLALQQAQGLALQQALTLGSALQQALTQQLILIQRIVQILLMLQVLL